MRQLYHQEEELYQKKDGLGRALSCIRQNLIKPYKELKTEEEREQYRKRRPEIEEIMKIVEEIDKNNIPTRLRNIREIKKWMERNETTILPRQSGKNVPEEEKRLGKPLSNIKHDLIRPYKELKTEEEREKYISKLENRRKEPISRDQFMEIIKTLEEIDKKNIKIPTSLKNIRDIKEWMEGNETTIPPRQKGENISEEEKRLGKALSNTRCSLIKPYKELKTEREREKYISKLENREQKPISRDQFIEIIKTVEEIDKKNIKIPTSLKNIRDIKEWMERNKTTRSPRQKGENISEESRLGEALKRIKNGLIKPYKELRSEEEREEYIGKLEDREQEPISREQFMEIIKTLEEIDIPTRLRNIRDIKEWMERNETTIPPRCKGEDISKEEEGLGKALSNIRCSLIKPYKELKTEEEREEYIGKLEDRKQEPISREQFMEIIKTEEEKRLGRALSTIRCSLIKPYKELKTEEEREEYISNLENKKIESLSRDQFMEIIKTVEEIDKKNIKIPTSLKNIRDIKEWMERNETTIPPRRGAISKEENQLGNALSTIRFSLIKPYKELKTEEREEYISKLENREQEPISRDQFMEIIKTVEEIDKKNIKIPTSLKNIRDIKEWMEGNETTRPPRQSGENRSEEEKRLGNALIHIRQKLINPYKKLKTEEEREEYISKLENRELEPLSRKQFIEIIKTVEEIDIPTSLRNIRDIKEWMERNETTRPPRQSGENRSEESRLGLALRRIKNGLIKPYKELRSEEEREEYIGKLEDKEREPLSRKQFMEIIETIEEIDGDREKLTDLVEQSKATQEKVAEAKKLESMYEQELKSKEQKEGFDIQDSDN